MSEQPDPTTPTLSYATPRPSPPGRQRPWVLAGLFFFLLIVALIMLPDLSGPRSTSLRVMDASNLRQIGQAILMYSNEHGGQYPDSLQRLLLTEDITPGVFVSTLTSDTPATGPTPQAWIAGMDLGNHLSYVYVGRGFNAATVIPSPGGIGALETGGAAVLALFGVNHVNALAFLFVYHFTQLVPLIVGGAMLLALRPQPIFVGTRAKERIG